MVAIKIVSYKFNIGGENTKIMKAKRGLRQGDLISPLLFVIVMEYLHRSLQKLKKVLDFNFHAKCKKLNIINLSFADDLILFVRGDTKSIELVMEKVNKFSKATRLYVNPSKCKAYFGSMEDNIKAEIKKITPSAEGPLPFRYLGVPPTSKKLSIHHYTSLIVKIVMRMKHWSNKLLSMQVGYNSLAV